MVLTLLPNFDFTASSLLLFTNTSTVTLEITDCRQKYLDGNSPFKNGLHHSTSLIFVDPVQV